MCVVVSNDMRFIRILDMPVFLDWRPAGNMIMIFKPLIKMAERYSMCDHFSFFPCVFSCSALFHV